MNHLIAHVEDAASTFEKSNGRSCPSLSASGVLSAGHMRRAPSKS